MNPRIIIYLFAFLLSIVGPTEILAQQVVDTWVYGGNDKVASNNCYIDQLGNRYQVIYTTANYFTVDSLGNTITINNPKLTGGSIASIIKFNHIGVYQYHINIPNSINLVYTSVTFDQSNNAYFTSRVSTLITPYAIYDGKKTPHTLPVNAGNNNTTIIFGKLTANGEFSWLRLIQRKNGNDLPLGIQYNFQELLTTNSSKNEIKIIAPNYRPINNSNPDTLIITSNSNLNDTIVVKSILLHLTFLSNGQFKKYVEPFKNQLTSTCDAVKSNFSIDEPVAHPYSHLQSTNKEYSLAILALGLSADDTLFLFNQQFPLYQGINYVLVCTNDNDSIIWVKSLSRTLTWTMINTTSDTNKNEFNVIFSFNPSMDVITIDPSLNNSLNPTTYLLKLNIATGSLIDVKNLLGWYTSVTWNPASQKYIYSNYDTYGFLDPNGSILSSKSVIPGPTSGVLLNTSNTTELNTDPNGYTYITGAITDSIAIDCLKRYANPNHIRQKVLVIKIAPLITKDTAACKPITSPSNKYFWDTSGVYYDTITSFTNCDSVLEIRFTNLSSKINYDTTVRVFMQSPSGKYIWGTTGIYNDTLTNRFGCDSVLIFNIKVLQTKHTIDTNVCNNYKSPSGIYWFDSTGIYTDTIPNFAGADSIITINLRVLKSFSNFDTAFCSSITSPSGKYIYNTTGIYTDTIKNTRGCDSIIIIRFNVQQTTDTITVNSCNTYLSPSGKYLYIQTGNYTDTLQTTLGCDSIIWIKYTNQKTIDTITIKRCDTTLSPSGKFTMNFNGIYLDTLIKSNGCDSILFIQFMRDTFDILLSKSNDISCDSPSTFLTTNAGNLFTWFENGNLLAYKSAGIQVAPSIQTLYKVVAQNNLGCTASDSIMLHVDKRDSTVTFNNIFTPNNDGTNDCYSIEGIEQFYKIMFEVYNRWGQLIFVTNDPKFCWNGLANNGNEVFSGTYFYTFEGISNCGNLLKTNGTITVVK